MIVSFVVVIFGYSEDMYMNITCHVFNVEYTVLIHLNFKRIVNTCIDLLIGNTNEIFFRKLLVLYTFF